MRAAASHVAQRKKRRKVVFASYFLVIFWYGGTESKLCVNEACKKRICFDVYLIALFS
jgi:hypothetical protein